MNNFQNYLHNVDFAGNFRAHAECLDFENNNGKRFVLLYADLLDSLKQICRKGPFIEKKFNGDWSYEEEKFRRVFGEVFKGPKSNSVATNLASQTPNTIKSLELYAGYLLKKDSTDATKGAILIEPKSLSRLFSLEARFLGWLKTKDLSEKSIQSYLGAISGTLSKISEINLFCITDVAEFDQLVQELQTNDNFLHLDKNGNGMYSAATKRYRAFLEDLRIAANGGETVEYSLGYSLLPKPFLLLAGISGTGKTRFVREQAKAAAVRYGMTKGENHCLVPVRPDWHEPSDLLGYISRIGNGGARYVTTDLLRFIVAAWQHLAAAASANQITQKPLNTICPYWLCLDEMNLAPVEQYFADYLSILETRTWKNRAYSCEPLLKPAVIKQQLDIDGQKDLWKNLGIDDGSPLSSGLREYFFENGIPLPPNLIVAGTVNMDETTHGFSRKVIDRALTLDFGEFFPNLYQHYFEHDKVTTFKPLGFPHLSEINKKDDLAGVVADPEGGETIAFLSAVNAELAGTPFELAYRALNEALLAVVCFNPQDEMELQAVWDDFLMMKVLPRIEGDAEKLGSQDDVSLLTRLTDLLKVRFSKIIADDRLDLLNMSAPDGNPVRTQCRSLKKLAWMQKRLSDNGFTSFWP